MFSTFFLIAEVTKNVPNVSLLLLVQFSVKNSNICTKETCIRWNLSKAVSVSVNSVCLVAIKGFKISMQWSLPKTDTVACSPKIWPWKLMFLYYFCSYMRVLMKWKHVMFRPYTTMTLLYSGIQLFFINTYFILKQTSIVLSLMVMMMMVKKKFFCYPKKCIVVFAVPFTLKPQKIEHYLKIHFFNDGNLENCHV